MDGGVTMHLAAGESVPEYLMPLTVLLCAAAGIGYASTRLRVVPIVGFLLAGVLIGPYQLGLVDSTRVVEDAADIGVILLLYTIGIEFSLERLAAIKRYVLVGGGLQVALAAGVTAGAAALFGAGWRAAVFTGLLVALSSTAIVLKVLASRGDTTRPVGQAGVAVLIFQDLAVVLMVLFLPLLAGEGGGPGEIARALGTAAAVLAVVLVVARKVMPPLLEAVARACSPEVFLLTVVALGIGTAFVTSLAGVSVALGAFLAGLVVSESRHGQHALGEVLPLQIVFSALFFVSIGMLLDLRALAELWWLIGLIALGVVAVKAVTGAVALAALRLGAPTAVAGGLMLAQIGEFSFVLQRAGHDAGLDFAALGDRGEQVLISVTVVLMVATPALAALGDRLGRVLGPRRGAAPAPSPAAKKDPAACAEEDPVLISGWGPVAREVAAALRARGVPVSVTTLGPDLAAEAEAAGYRVVRGDPVKRNVLEQAGLRSARLVLICENDGEEAAAIAAVIARAAPDAPIAVCPVDVPDPRALARAGADRVVDAPASVADRVCATVLRRLGTAPAAPGDRPATDTVVDFRPDPQAACPHAPGIRPVLPRSAGCTACLREGRRDWVHLRTCLTCGHVGCCDSSPSRHASAHAADHDHPVAASAEPGEEWAWCFEDRTTMPAAD
ncbi:cation:proton antiporter domain-containing protein [Nocardiopsis halophila]|uniref:cation:proton antiporter domain-containing protein n=1 Tax=Nocardiopsis halophila TaxID=141692 RepID=UPI000380CBB2|nr:cation:proton antiporter [Nocardiopsis halophila]